MVSYLDPNIQRVHSQKSSVVPPFEYLWEFDGVIKQPGYGLSQGPHCPGGHRLGITQFVSSDQLALSLQLFILLCADAERLNNPFWSVLVAELFTQVSEVNSILLLFLGGSTRRVSLLFTNMTSHCYGIVLGVKNKTIGHPAVATSLKQESNNFKARN